MGLPTDMKQGRLHTDMEWMKDPPADNTEDYIDMEDWLEEDEDNTVDYNSMYHFRIPLGLHTDMRQERLLRHMKWMKDPPAGITGSFEDDDVTAWNATISGPVESPWEGGVFKLTLRFPPDYPFKPPKVRFVSRMFHPNIYPDGSICLDFLQDDWSPAYHVPQILVSIQSLLCDPNPNSPVNSDAAHMFIENRREYNLKIREIVELSQCPNDTLQSGCGSLEHMDMGVSSDTVSNKARKVDSDRPEHPELFVEQDNDENFYTEEDEDNIEEHARDVR